MKRIFTHLGKKSSVSIFIILIVIFREVISKMHFNRSICPIITTKRMLFLCVIPVIGQSREDYVGLILVQSLTASVFSLLSNPSTFRRGGRCLINILINSLRTKQWYKLSCSLTAKSIRYLSVTRPHILESMCIIVMGIRLWAQRVILWDNEGHCEQRSQKGEWPCCFLKKEEGSGNPCKWVSVLRIKLGFL